MHTPDIILCALYIMSHTWRLISTVSRKCAKGEHQGKYECVNRGRNRKKCRTIRYGNCIDKREMPSLHIEHSPGEYCPVHQGSAGAEDAEDPALVAVRSEAMKRNMDLQHSAMEDAKKVREARRTAKALGDCASCGTGKRRTRKRRIGKRRTRKRRTRKRRTRKRRTRKRRTGRHGRKRRHRKPDTKIRAMSKLIRETV